MTHGRSFVILSLILIAFFDSCTSDYMDKGQSYYSSDWCIAQGKYPSLYFMSDGDEVLIPNNQIDSSFLKPGARCYVTYTLLGSPVYKLKASPGRRIDLAAIQPVYIENAMNATDYTGRATDPLMIYPRPNIGGGFLNLIFSFHSSSASVKHGVHLLRDSLAGRTMYMRLVHDAKMDNGSASYSVIASFPLGSIEKMNQADSIVMRYQTDNGENTYTIVVADSI